MTSNGKLRVAYFYDRVNRDWVVQLVDLDGDFVEVGSFERREEARSVVRMLKQTLYHVGRFARG